jgi:hypothetical protein
MRMLVDIARATFLASKAPEPKTEMGSQKQKINKRTGELEWVVELLAMDDTGGEVVRVTVTGEQPRVGQGQAVRVEGFEVVPWSNNGRTGVAYRATSITPHAQPKAA